MIRFLFLCGLVLAGFFVVQSPERVGGVVDGLQSFVSVVKPVFEDGKLGEVKSVWFGDGVVEKSVGGVNFLSYGKPVLVEGCVVDEDCDFFNVSGLVCVVNTGECGVIL